MLKWALIFLMVWNGITAATAQPSIKVIVSFSILEDLVANIGGETVFVKALVGPNSDAHIFEPEPETVRLIAEADLIVINGLGFEGWMSRLLSSTKTKATIVVASEGIKTRSFLSQSTKVVVDPHAWHDVKNVILYIDNIEKPLLELMPEAAHTIRENANLYRAKLKNLEAWIHTEIKSIPPNKRKVVTAHDAFGYFGEAYYVKFLSAQGLSTESEPSAKDIANLIKKIKKEGIGAVFIENIMNERLMRHIAEEVGIEIGETLYSDALSEPHGPAATYVDMMKTNVQRLKVGMLKNKN